MAVVDLTALSENLTKDKTDYEKIFGLKMASGFAAKGDFVVLGINQEIELVRDELSNLTQPGRTGTTNFTTQAIKQKSRKGSLKPAKVDLKLTEVELYNLRTSYLGRKEKADPKDIHSLAGRTYIMGRVFDRIGKEVNRAIYKGVEDRTNGTQGGINLFDGLNFKFVQGFTVVGSGGVEDIPAGNKVTSPAGTMTAAVILAELKKMVELILANEDLVEYRDEAASLFMNPIWFQWILDALDSALTNGSQVVTKKGDKLFLNALPGTEIKPRVYMIGVSNMFWTVDGNLFYLHQDTEEDIPRMKFQEVDRDLKILIDFEVNVEYADGRLIVLWK
jgi:hypothetical protein